MKLSLLLLNDDAPDDRDINHDGAYGVHDSTLHYNPDNLSEPPTSGVDNGTLMRTCRATSCKYSDGNMLCILDDIDIDEKGVCEQFVLKDKDHINSANSENNDELTIPGEHWTQGGEIF